VLGSAGYVQVPLIPFSMMGVSGEHLPHAVSEKLQCELARCRTALSESQERHRDTTLLLEHLSGQNAELRDELQHAQAKLGDLDGFLDDSDTRDTRHEPFLSAGSRSISPSQADGQMAAVSAAVADAEMRFASAEREQAQEFAASRTKTRETIQALEVRMQAAVAEAEQWRRYCRELESKAREPTPVSPLQHQQIQQPDVHLAAVELATLRHRVWQLEQDLQVEKRLAGELRMEGDRRQALLGAARKEVDQGRGHITDLRQQVIELEEMRVAASDDWWRGQQDKQRLEQQVETAQAAMEAQRQALAEQHANESKSLQLEMARLKQELDDMRSSMSVSAASEPAIPPPPRSTSDWLLASAPPSARSGRTQATVPPSWCIGGRGSGAAEDGALRRKCRQCQFFYFPGDGQQEDGQKCRQCQYYYFSPDGPVSPDQIQARMDAGSNSSPSRSPKRPPRMPPGAAAAMGAEREAKTAASVEATRMRLEVSALESSLHEQEAACCRSEQEAQRSSEAAVEVAQKSERALLQCRALAEEEISSAEAWRAEAGVHAAELAEQCRSAGLWRNEAQAHAAALAHSQELQSAQASGRKELHKLFEEGREQSTEYWSEAVDEAARCLAHARSELQEEAGRAGKLSNDLLKAQAEIGRLEQWATSELTEEAGKTATLRKDLQRTQAEILRLQDQGCAWERRRNLWEERCASCEGELASCETELEEARRELTDLDAEHGAVQCQLTEACERLAVASEDVSSRLVSAKSNALTSIAEDARAALAEHRACLAHETDQRAKAEQSLLDLRANHERWCLLLQAAGNDRPLSPKSLMTLCKQDGDEEVSAIIEGHIRRLDERLALLNGEESFLAAAACATGG